KLIVEMNNLQEQQHTLAGLVNIWRDRARDTLRQQNDEMLRAYLAEMKSTEDLFVQEAAERVLFVMDAPEEELAKLASQIAPREIPPTTAVGRLIERAGKEFDLRGVDPKPRRAAAIEFANRPSMINNDEVLAELEASLTHPDPLTREIITHTLIQLHRIRGLRVAELDVGYNSVKRLRQVDDPSVIAVFIEILQNPRTGYITGEDGQSVQSDNDRARRVALGGLVEWHTPEAQRAVQQCQFDQDPQIVKLAAVALELYPGEWKGPTPETRKARPERVA
ncbi:MAG: HEAT repeat domain-containing protein, partial [Anaerolineales bacterium]